MSVVDLAEADVPQPGDEVRKAWKRYLEGLPADGLVRPVILASWQRSRQAGVDPRPDELDVSRVADEDIARRLKLNSNLLAVAKHHLEYASALLHEVPHVVYLTDRDGIVLFSVGARVWIERFGLGSGYDWSERAMGTNGAGTALAADQPVAVVGPEHFEHTLHDCTCTAAPLHDSDGAVIGAIDISTSVAAGNPERVVLAVYFASMIERELGLRNELEYRKWLEIKLFVFGYRVS